MKKGFDRKLLVQSKLGRIVVRQVLAVTMERNRQIQELFRRKLIGLVGIGE